jgi:DHA1 family tetracycline resistance protein-like MFS transporter
MGKTDTQRRLALLFVFVFVDVLGFSLILPLLPYYAEDFATESTVGLLLAANALTQLVGAPVLGQLSDRYGRRPLLILSITGTIAGFLLLGWSDALWMLFASRILDGLLGGDISLAQAYITDVTDEESRAKGLGLIGASFGLGFIVGPILGGTLSVGANYSLPAFVAAGLATFNLLGVLVWLPESLPPERRASTNDRDKASLSIRALLQALRRPCVGPLLVVTLLSGLAFTAFETTFSLFTKTRLQMTAQTTSYILAYVGLLVAAIQGGGIRLLIKRFTEKQLIFGGSILLAITLLAWGLTPVVWLLLIVLAPLALASGMLRVSTNSALTKSVYPEEVGGALGLAAALAGFARVVAPIVGAFLLERVSPAAPGVLGSVLMMFVALFVWRRVLFVPDAECPAPPEPLQASASRRRSVKAWHVLLWLVPLAALGGMAITGGIVMRPMPEALEALTPGEGVIVETKPWLTFHPADTEPSVGLIFYPGARADARAYAPAARAIASEGYRVVVVPMPLNMAFFDRGAARRVIAAYPDVEHWAIGGHSLGGAMAASFARNHPDDVEGLTVWAPYYLLACPDLSEHDLGVVTVYGTLDGLIAPETVEASRPCMPADARWIVIEGGNHAQFSWYGGQTGDNPAAITRETQQQQAIDAALSLLSDLE